MYKDIVLSNIIALFNIFERVDIPNPNFGMKNGAMPFVGRCIVVSVTVVLLSSVGG